MEPVQFGDLRIHLWALLELKHAIWGLSDVVAPVSRLIGQSEDTSSIAVESVRSDVMKSVASLADEGQ